MLYFLLFSVTVLYKHKFEILHFMCDQFPWFNVFVGKYSNKLDFYTVMQLFPIFAHAFYAKLSTNVSFRTANFLLTTAFIFHGRRHCFSSDPLMERDLHLLFLSLPLLFWNRCSAFTREKSREYLNN